MNDSCTLCPLSCKTNRNIAKGACSSQGLNIAKYGLFAYEEPCISFNGRSGAVFFTGCSLKCVFCQNFELSRGLRGKDITPDSLAQIFRELEESGAENINLVNPTHHVDGIIRALQIYRPRVPVVYNSHGYEATQTLQKIDPYVDIYLPDFKFFSEKQSLRYTKKADYFARASKAIAFMAQKPTSFTKDGKMLSGMIIRHLILPLGTADSIAVLNWIAENLSTNCHVSVMGQYTPFGEIEKFPELQRKITRREYEKVLSHAVALGFTNVYAQELTSSDESYIPHWDF